MRERARVVHGKLEIDSEPNGGTTVRLELPLGEIDAGSA
jgi:signal transduction histidine kinase